MHRPHTNHGFEAQIMTLKVQKLISFSHSYLQPIYAQQWLNVHWTLNWYQYYRKNFYVECRNYAEV